FLREKLPDYMVPAAIVELDALPLNPNGKVDRKALPAPDDTRPVARSYVEPRTALEIYLAAMWGEILKREQVGVYDNFFESGGDSILAAVLANRIQEELQVSAHVRSIFYAPTVAELAMYFNEYFPEVVKSRFGEASSVSLKEKLEEELEPEAEGQTITAETLERFRACIPPLPPRPEGPRAKNPQAVFLLSPPRSGSTLLRVMLAGHPQLFAPPELELLTFNTLEERRVAFSGVYEPVLEGTIRALMEVTGLDTDEATALMEQFERRNTSTADFYATMQERLDGRLLVDKTPAYAMDMAVLQRAEEEFDEPKYIHLVRNPYATIYSFVEARLQHFFFRHPHPFSVRELAELIWTASHQNILHFCQQLPAERSMRVYYEELVANPQPVMERMCAFLGIPFDMAMLKPYEGKRMTDGLRPMSQMVGDLKFYLRKEIDSKAADRWKKFHANDFLGPVSRSIATELGYASETETAATATPTGPITPVSRDGALPLSFGQQRLWFLDQLEPDSPLYNIPIALRLRGTLNEAALHHALNGVVVRHESLRTTFSTVEGQPVQVIAPAASVDISVSDLTELPANEREAEATRRVAAEAARPFDLTTGPLLRAGLLRLSDDEHIFQLTLHHIISDGWSGNVLVQDFAALYAGVDEYIGSPLQPLSVQYADYAAWQRASLQGELREKQLDFWRATLAGAPALLELPTDRPRPPMLSNEGARMPFVLSPALSQRLRALSQREGTTLFMTMLAAWNIFLMRYSGQEDICIGTPVANRTRPEIEPLIGFFVNTLVLRTDLSGEPSFRDLLKRVQAVTSAAYAHADVPFEMLVDALQPERSMSHTPLFQVAMAMQRGGHLLAMELPGLRLEPLHADSGTAKFDLMLSVLERTDGLSGALEYNTSLFDASTIARMWGHFQNLLEAIVAAPETSITRLALLTAVEREQILYGWNDTAVSYPPVAALHHLFEAQVERTPDAVAMITWSDSNAETQRHRDAENTKDRIVDAAEG
nr:condensation domain-containing protein [Chloroflexaceae bacterium]